MKVFFLIRNFPILSQTFVIDNILSVAEEKIPFKILTYKKNEVYKNVADSSKVKDYIKEKNIEEIKEQSSGFIRFFESILYLLNPKKFYFFLKLSILRKKLSFSHIYQMKSFSKIGKDSVLHVHFANSIYHMKDFLKVGFISPNVIVSIHGKDTIWLERFVRHNSNVELLESTVNKFLCNSRFTKEKLLEYGFSSKKLKVHYLGIDTFFFRPYQTTKTITNELNLISVGRLIQLKGHYYAILAVEKLVLNGVNVRYKIIGEGPEFLPLSKMIKEKKLDNIVELCGRMNKLEIKHELNNSDLFLFPSTFCDKTKRREAFGIASLEAQSMGLPVIGFNSGGFVETIIDNQTGYIVEDRNSDELAYRIQNLYNDNKLLMKMCKNAKSHVREHFDARKSNQLLLNLYKQKN